MSCASTISATSCAHLPSAGVASVFDRVHLRTAVRFAEGFRCLVLVNRRSVDTACVSLTCAQTVLPVEADLSGPLFRLELFHSLSLFLV